MWPDDSTHWSNGAVMAHHFFQMTPVKRMMWDVGSIDHELCYCLDDSRLHGLVTQNLIVQPICSQPPLNLFHISWTPTALYFSLPWGWACWGRKTLIYLVEMAQHVETTLIGFGPILLDLPHTSPLSWSRHAALSDMLPSSSWWMGSYASGSPRPSQSGILKEEFLSSPVLRKQLVTEHLLYPLKS